MNAARLRRHFPAPAGALTLLALLGLSACGGSGSQPSSGEAAELPPVRAVVARAERLEVAGTVPLRGSVEAARVATVSSRVMATVTATPKNTGDRVARGEVLLEIDPETARGQLSQARGALAQAEANLALAEKNLQRYQALAATGAAAPLELDQAETQHEQARGAVEQARGAVASAGSVAAEARVVAPFAGRVLRRLAEVGDLAAPGRPLMTIEADGPRRLAVSVPESVLGRSEIAVGTAVPVALDGWPDLGRFAGTVEEITPGADPASHAFTVKIALPVENLPTGGAGRAWIASGSRSVVVVPRAAVLAHGGLELVVVKDEAGRTSTRAVTTGEESTDGEVQSVEILSGLAGGEQVLVGLEGLPPAGSPVEEVRAMEEVRG